MKKSEKLKYCSGCNDNFYNGNNALGVKVCRSLSSAKLLLKKEVPRDQRPPWNQKPIKVLNCFRQTGYVYVGKKQIC